MVVECCRCVASSGRRNPSRGTGAGVQGPVAGLGLPAGTDLLGPLRLARSFGAFFTLGAHRRAPVRKPHHARLSPDICNILQHASQLLFRALTFVTHSFVGNARPWTRPSLVFLPERPHGRNDWGRRWLKLRVWIAIHRFEPAWSVIGTARGTCVYHEQRGSFAIWSSMLGGRAGDGAGR